MLLISFAASYRSASSRPSIFLALANLFSEMESQKTVVALPKVLPLTRNAMTHGSAAVRAAGCTCFKNVFQSAEIVFEFEAKNDTNQFLKSLVHFWCDSSHAVQIAALKAISNFTVDFIAKKSQFISLDGVKQLCGLLKATINAISALRKLAFRGTNHDNRKFFYQFPKSIWISALGNSEAIVRKNFLHFLACFVDAHAACIEYIFDDEDVLIAVAKEMQGASSAVVIMQGMYILTCVASLSSYKSGEVDLLLLQDPPGSGQPIIFKISQSTDTGFQIARAWTIINLVLPMSSRALAGIGRLLSSGIRCQLRTMILE